MAINIEKARTEIVKWNRVLNDVADGKSSNQSTFQNQILKENSNGLNIWDKNNELLALALAILEASDEVSPAITKALAIRIKKARDYNGGGITLEHYFPFGLKSYVQEIHKKSLRLVSLAADGRTPENESVEDTLVDMINYCCFAVEAGIK